MSYPQIRIGKNKANLKKAQARQTLLQAELAVADDKFAQIQALINPYHALGGGY